MFKNLIMVFGIFVFCSNGLTQTLEWSCSSQTDRFFNTDFQVDYNSTQILNVSMNSRRSSGTQDLPSSGYLFSTQQTLFCSVIQFSSQDYVFLIKIDEPTFPARPVQSRAELYMVDTPDPQFNCVTLDYLILNEIIQPELSGWMNCSLRKL